MSTMDQRLQGLYRLYKRETGIKAVDMHEVAKWAEKKGFPLPPPPDPIDLLAKAFSRAARQETRTDEETHFPYRANHAFKVQHGPKQLMLWVDIDEATRPQMWKSSINRRDQMVGDAYHLTLDVDHWNRVNPDDKPIQVPLDFTDDVEWRKNTPLLEEAS